MPATNVMSLLTDMDCSSCALRGGKKCGTFRVENDRGKEDIIREWHFGVGMDATNNNAAKKLLETMSRKIELCQKPGNIRVKAPAPKNYIHDRNYRLSVLLDVVDRYNKFMSGVKAVDSLPREGANKRRSLNASRNHSRSQSRSPSTKRQRTSPLAAPEPSTNRPARLTRAPKRKISTPKGSAAKRVKRCAVKRQAEPSPSSTGNSKIAKISAQDKPKPRSACSPIRTRSVARALAQNAAKQSPAECPSGPAHEQLPSAKTAQATADAQLSPSLASTSAEIPTVPVKAQLRSCFRTVAEVSKRKLVLEDSSASAVPVQAKKVRFNFPEETTEAAPSDASESSTSSEEEDSATDDVVYVETRHPSPPPSNRENWTIGQTYDFLVQELFEGDAGPSVTNAEPAQEKGQDVAANGLVLCLDFEAPGEDCPAVALPISADLASQLLGGEAHPQEEGPEDAGANVSDAEPLSEEDAASSEPERFLLELQEENLPVAGPDSPFIAIKLSPELGKHLLAAGQAVPQAASGKVQPSCSASSLEDQSQTEQTEEPSFAQSLAASIVLLKVLGSEIKSKFSGMFGEEALVNEPTGAGPSTSAAGRSSASASSTSMACPATSSGSPFIPKPGPSVSLPPDQYLKAWNVDMLEQLSQSRSASADQTSGGDDESHPEFVEAKEEATREAGRRSPLKTWQPIPRRSSRVRTPSAKRKSALP